MPQASSQNSSPSSMTETDPPTPPPEKEQLDTRITIRLPARVRNDWRLAANKAEMSLPDWLRTQVVVDGCDPTRREPKRIWPKRRRTYLPVDPSLVISLRNLGNNVNQIARNQNMGRRSYTDWELLVIMRAVGRELMVMKEQFRGNKKR